MQTVETGSQVAEHGVQVAQHGAHAMANGTGVAVQTAEAGSNVAVNAVTAESQTVEHVAQQVVGTGATSEVSTVGEQVAKDVVPEVTAPVNVVSTGSTGAVTSDVVDTTVGRVGAQDASEGTVSNASTKLATEEMPTVRERNAMIMRVRSIRRPELGGGKIDLTEPNIKKAFDAWDGAINKKGMTRSELKRLEGAFFTEVQNAKVAQFTQRMESKAAQEAAASKSGIFNALRGSAAESKQAAVAAREAEEKAATLARTAAERTEKETAAALAKAASDARGAIAGTQGKFNLLENKIKILEKSGKIPSGAFDALKAKFEAASTAQVKDLGEIRGFRDQVAELARQGGIRV